jgi:small subunit ribosomal protein S2
MAPVVTMRQLLESGVHFGHQTRRWNPKMKRFILAERNGIYIIDLQQSLDFIDTAYEFIKETVAHGGSILYVGTKKQAQEAVAEQARRVGMPFVNQRWLGGMLTNFQTVFKRLQRLKELEELDFDDVAGSGMTKKELLQLRRERDKLERSLGGIRDMSRVPSAIWVVDTKKEHIAVSEARKLGIPVIAILDTNCDPDEVTYPIPGNDDAIRSVSLLTRVVADAVADGLIARAGAADGEAKPSAAPGSGELGAEEPLAEWELAVLEGKGSDDAAAQAPDAESPEAQSPEAQSPEAQSPEAQSPEAQSPEVQSPEAQSPEVQSPEAQSPEAQSPEAQSPEAQSPEAQSPEVQSPEAQSPEVQSPEAQSPEAESPEVQSPDAQNSEAPAAGEANGTAPEQDEAPAPEPEAAGVAAGSGESREA